MKALRVDVQDEDATNAMARSLQQEWEGIDVLVNNAGISQNLPLALLEGLAAGLPIVISRIKGNRELVAGAKGYLCEPRNPEAYATALADSDSSFIINGGAGWMFPFVNQDPFLAPLREDPRFQDLMRRMNLPVQ